MENGTIEGNYDTKPKIQTYPDVPFARKPVGELRWKEPQALENWQVVKEAKKFGPRTLQTVILGDMNSRSNGVSELFCQFYKNREFK
ncbi:MAG: carboxylesterase family protein [Ferruginibacter sp.]